jgi:hypothetical protein
VLTVVREESGGRSAPAMRRVLLLCSTEASFGALVDAFELSQSSYGRGAQAVRLGPVEVTALAMVTHLRTELLDSP